MLLIQPIALALLALAAPQPAGPTEVRGDCSLTVGKRVVLNIKRTCRISLFGDGGFSINTKLEDDGDPRPFRFAYLNLWGDGKARLFWNADIRFDHTQSPLGDDFRRKGGCWIGRRATICAYRR